MNVSLPEGLEEFVRKQVESGLYDSCSEVHRDGLRLLKARQDQERVKLGELQRLVAEGTDGLRNGEGVSFEVEDLVRLGKERQATRR